MKNLAFLLALTVLICHLQAQPFGDAAAGYRIIKQEYANANGEKASTRFKYDQAGRLIRAYWTLDDQSRNSVNYYEYDSQGRLISAFRVFSDSMTSFELFAYDSQGNKVSEHFYRSDGNTGSASYSYSDNCIEQADFKKHKGWLSGTLHYTCNEQKKRKSALLKDGDQTTCHVSYEYDENNNLVKEYWDFQGKWFQSYKFHYEKTDQPKNYYSSPFLTNTGNYRISKEAYTFNDELGGPSLYDYDEQGMLTRKVFQRSDTFLTTTLYQYDANRKLVSSERNASDGSTVQFNYIYDENNRLIQRTYISADTLAGFESYLYNQDGDLIKAYIRNFDGWLTGTLDFDHDELGTLTSARFKGEDGFDAFITFKYNEAGLLTEICWDFTFGKFQRYTYQYEIIGKS